MADTTKSINVFEYNSYREFLRDWFDVRRRESRAFSLRLFAQKSGLSSHSFISSLIRGRRNLTTDTTEKIINGMRLDEQHAAFFRLLVRYNQAKTQAEKESLFDELNVIRRNTAYFRLNKKHFDYLSHWYLPVIRELCVHADWGGDYKKLGNMVEPPISESQARRAVKVLLKTEVIAESDNGRFVQTNQTISTKDIPGHLVRKFRGQFIELSRKASEEMAPQRRKMDSTVLALSKANRDKAMGILEEARKKIISLSGDESDLDSVFMLNMHFFPVSESISGKGDQGGSDVVQN